MLYNDSRSKYVTYMLLLYEFLSGVDLQTVVDGGNLLSTIKKIFSLWKNETCVRLMILIIMLDLDLSICTIQFNKIMIYLKIFNYRLILFINKLLL